MNFASVSISADLLLGPVIEMVSIGEVSSAIGSIATLVAEGTLRSA